MPTAQLRNEQVRQMQAAQSARESVAVVVRADHSFHSSAESVLCSADCSAVTGLSLVCAAAQ